MVLAYVEREIDVPIDRAWDLMADFANVHHIHPMVESVNMKTLESNCVGATRVCNLYDGNYVKEKIVEWNEEEKFYKIKLIESSVPLKGVDLKLVVKPAGGADKTKLIAEMDIQVKYGIFGKIMERLVMKPKFGTAIGDLFAGAEVYDKTGKNIENGFKPKTPALVK